MVKKIRRAPASQPVALDEALRKATRAYDAEAKANTGDSGPGPGDYYRPFDIAQRAIELMFPGIQEEDIELPAWEFPNLPSAREVVMHHLEMTGARPLRGRRSHASITRPTRRLSKQASAKSPTE